MRKSNRLLCLALLLVVIVLALIPAACGISGYKTFTLKRGIGYFTFEYPSNYKVARMEVQDGGLFYTDVILNGPFLEKEQDFPLIGVLISRISEQQPNKEAAAEELLSLVSAFPDFKLLERSQVTVDGSEGDQLTFSYAQAVAGQSLSTISRDAFFEQGGLIWNITMRSPATILEANKAHFEHLLQTFRVLN